MGMLPMRPGAGLTHHAPPACRAPLCRRVLPLPLWVQGHSDTQLGEQGLLAGPVGWPRTGGG